MLEIRGGQFRMTGIPLKMVRPFLYREISLGEEAARFTGAVPWGTPVLDPWLSVLCMHSKAWLAAPVLLAHADVTKTYFISSMGPTLRYPTVA